MVEISNETPIKEFPEIYNENNAELKKKIETLETSLSEMKSKYDAEIKKRDNELKELYSTMLKQIDERMEQYESMFIKVSEVPTFDGSDSE